jgi:methyl-accepting chemotaxis protein-1 (serine sensor receptor)
MRRCASLYEDRLVAFSQLERMPAALDAARNGISTSIGRPGDIDANMDRIEKPSSANDVLKQYQETQLTSEERALLDKLVPAPEVCHRGHQARGRSPAQS